jgi:hypothetical protein
MNTYRTLLLSSALAIALGFTSVFAADKLERRTSNASAVIVAVKPLDLAPGAKSWDFEVTMNTHVHPLEQDLTEVSALVDKAGARHVPMAWKGDPPGGHHRKGVLQFTPLAGSPEYVELQIRDVGSPGTRTFKWQLR